MGPYVGHTAPTPRLNQVSGGSCQHMLAIGPLTKRGGRFVYRFAVNTKGHWSQTARSWVQAGPRYAVSEAAALAHALALWFV